METEWCDCTSGVRQVCPLSPLLFNIYVRELGMRLDECKNRFSYTVMSYDGIVETKVWSGFLYADDICLVANSSEHFQMIIDE